MNTHVACQAGWMPPPRLDADTPVVFRRRVMRLEDLMDRELPDLIGALAIVVLVRQLARYGSARCRDVHVRLAAPAEAARFEMGAH